jgi:hypothetical protein
MTKSTFSISGPICPYCAYQMNPGGEPHLYDEDTAELQCWSCDKPFRVEVYTQTSWTCSAIDGADQSNQRTALAGTIPDTDSLSASETKG